VTYPPSSSGKADDVVAELTSAATSFEVTLQPGNGIKVGVAMKACPESKPPVCDETGASYDEATCAAWEVDGNAFKGESAAFDYDGSSSDAIILNVICVDQAVIFDPIVMNIDNAANNFPLVMQMNIVPALLKYGAKAAITAEAKDVIGGVGSIPKVTAAEWSITSSATLEASTFSPQGTTCEDASDCEFEFAAIAGAEFLDKGNIGFEVEVTGSNGVKSKQLGVVTVDPRGTLSVGTLILNIPEITTTKLEVAAQAAFSADLTANGEATSTSTIALAVRDLDFLDQDDEELSYDFTAVSIDVDQRVVDGDRQSMNCATLVSTMLAQPSAGQDSATFTIAADASEFATSDGLPFGITQCRYTVKFMDNSKVIAANVVEGSVPTGTSATFSFDHMVYPEVSDADSSEFLILQPTITSTFLAPKSVSADDEVITFVVEFTDTTSSDDISINLVAGTGDAAKTNMDTLSGIAETVTLLSAGTPQTISGLTNLKAGGVDCTGGCKIQMTTTRGDIGGDDFTLYILDGDYDGTLSSLITAQATFVLTEGYSVEGAAQRRRRSVASASSIPASPFSTSVVDGKLMAELSPEFQAQMGSLPASTDAPSNPAGDSDVSSTSSLTAIVGASAGAVVALIAVVAVVAVSVRKSKIGKVYPVANAGFQANPALEDRASATWF